MALWVQNEKKQRKIEEYFSSINSMTMRIMEERNKAINHYKGCWDKLSYNEQDKKMDEWFASPLLKKKYSETDDSKSDQSVKVYPTLKLNSGQKIQILDSEIQASWRDEHSDPFCCETKSQMDLRLPGSSSSADVKNKSPSSSLDRTSERTYAQGEIHEQVISSSSEKDFFTTEPDFATNEENRSHGQAALAGGVSKFPTSEIKSFNIDDLTITRCDLDEGYTKPTGRVTVEPRVDERWGQSFADKNLMSDFWKPGQPAQSKDGRRDETSHFDENRDQSKLKKNKNSVKTYSKQSPTLPLKRADSREKQSIACKKVVREDKLPSSGYSNTNPLSSLTLDGAIYNLEVAMRQSSQTSNTDNTNAEPEDIGFNFSDFGKFSSGLDSNNGLGNISGERESPVLDQKDVEIVTGGVTSGANNAHKSGFDFLDNW